MSLASVRERLSTARAYRLESIDMVRGVVIVIMAIDHVRDFFNFGGEPDPLANPDIGAAIFFTRWITHFCAPVFVFLAGTSAGLMASRKTPSALGAFLFRRGWVLIFIEWFIVATAWSFAPWGIEQLDGRIGVVMQVPSAQAWSSWPARSSLGSAHASASEARFWLVTIC